MTLGDVAFWTVFSAGALVGMVLLAGLLLIAAAVARRFDQ